MLACHMCMVLEGSGSQRKRLLPGVNRLAGESVAARLFGRAICMVWNAGTALNCTCAVAFRLAAADITMVGCATRMVVVSGSQCQCRVRSEST
jgi:hypothetical protein